MLEKAHLIIIFVFFTIDDSSEEAFQAEFQAIEADLEDVPEEQGIVCLFNILLIY